MIQKLMKGRLGNQLFQYAVARALHEKFDKNGDIILAFTEKYYNEEKRNDNFYNQLIDFNLPEYVKYSTTLEITDKQKQIIDELDKKRKALYNTYGQDFEEKYITYEKEIQPFLNENGICSMHNCYYPFEMKDNCVLLGYLETAKYFDDVKHLIQKDFTPKHAPLEKNKELYSQIQNSNSVCISIRRGDFVNNDKIRDKHYICNEEYFKKAISKINSKLENPKFVFFSDDIEWVKNNIEAPEGSLYEDGTDPVWEKLRLMYNCKHFVLSNSTFSWWAQYLSRNDEKVVVAPSKWSNFGYNPDIFQENWLLIDVDKDKELEK